MGLINKPLVIVPNHILEQWNRDFHNAYPNANVLVADKESFEKNGREAFFSKIASNDWDCVIMTHSQVQNLPLPMEYFERYIYEQKQELEQILKEVSGTPKEIKNARKSILNDMVKLEKDLNKQRESQTDSIDFSELGIDSLVVDESQEFKNLSVKTKMKNVLGLGTDQASMKAQKLFSLTSYMHKNNKRVMFLTGTPISNSLTEIYTLQKYLQPELLNEKGLNTFDNWAKVFGNPTNDFELDSSGVNYKMVTRFSELQNMPELSAMYKSNAHIITNEDILKVFPEFVPQIKERSNGERTPEIVTVGRSPQVARYFGVPNEDGKYEPPCIIWRMDNFSKNPKRNNMLAVTTDARKAGLDYRLIDPSAEVDDEHSKSSEMVKNIVNEYHLWDKDKGTQLVFCNLSTPTCKSQSVNVYSDTQIKDESLNAIMLEQGNESIESESKELSQDELIAKEQKFDVYSDVLKKLVKAGIPQREIAFIHDATTDIQKRDLFDKVNRGDIRVLIGSTFKMGAGTNVQERIVALHNLDCPWRPSDLAQGDGRAIRQGNALHKKYGHDNFAIGIYRYATEQTYDARMWQTIEFKARGIEAFKNACKDPSQRTLEDVSMGSASAAEMKAAATGNPLFLTQQQIKAELRKEENRERAFKRDLYATQEKLKSSIAYTPFIEKDLHTLKDIKNMLDSNPKTESFMCECFDGEKFNIIKIDDGKTPKERELDSSIKTISKELDSMSKNEAQSQQMQELKAKLDSLKIERAELLYPTIDKLKEAVNELNPTSNGEAKRFIENFIKPLETKMDKAELDLLANSVTQKANLNAQKASTLDGASELSKANENKKSVEEKAFEDMFWKNFDNALDSGGDEVPFFKYRGLHISGAFNDRLDEFSLSITDGSGKNYIEPDNLVYKMNRANIFENNWRNKISFNGLWRRINNFCNDIDKQIATQEKALIENNEMIQEFEKQVKNSEYPNKAYLSALRDDDKQILIEINKCASNKNYKSSFEPKSTQIKAAQQKARREAALQELNTAER